MWLRRTISLLRVGSVVSKLQPYGLFVVTAYLPRSTGLTTKLQSKAVSNCEWRLVQPSLPKVRLRGWKCRTPLLCLRWRTLQPMRWTTNQYKLHIAPIKDAYSEAFRAQPWDCRNSQLILVVALVIHPAIEFMHAKNLGSRFTWSAQRAKYGRVRVYKKVYGTVAMPGP